MNKEIMQQASQWLIEINSPDCSAETKKRFEHWLFESERHQMAFEKALTIWEQLPASQVLQSHAHKLNKAQEQSTERGTNPGFFDFWKWSPIAACFALCALLIVFWPFSPQPHFSSQVYRTAVGEIKSFTLTDGSVVTLGGKSVLVSNYSQEVRRTRLDSGEAYFDIVAAPSRPFVVETGDTQIKVLGTEFEVRKQTDRLQLSVAQGKVEITDSQGLYRGTQSRHQLTAGQWIRYHNSTGLGDVEQISTDIIANWREQRFDFEDAPLSQIVERLNLYYPPGVVLLSDTQTEKVTASFSLTQLEAFLSGLAATYPVRVEQDEAGKYMILKKSS